ncbi:MAG: glycosyltransferase [Bryobacteraceae bacterium]|nr:glycosyltransferase [Bryobacteraceae bacterium]
MRIVHAIGNLKGGGAETQLRYLAPELARRGHEVWVVHLRDDPTAWGETGSGVRFHRLGTPGTRHHSRRSWRNYDPRLPLRLIRLVRRTRSHVLQSWIVQMDILSAIAARFTGTKWVLREPSANFAHGGLKTRLRVRLAKGAAAIVANSKEGVRYWERTGSDARLIPNGVPLDRFDRAEAAPGDGRKRILFAGRLQPFKNVRLLAQAFAEVMRRRPGVVAEIAGDGPERAAVAETIAAAGGGVIMRGVVADGAPYLKRADVFVSLSKLEGFPNTILEAMACGRPIVASDIPQHRDILAAPWARLVSPDRPEEAVAAILGTLDDPDWARNRELARRRAGDFQVQAMADRYERLYEELLA